MICAGGIDDQTVFDGAVDLRRAAVEVLRDDPAGWPPVAHLDGLTYTTLLSPLPASARLARDPGGYHPQPYEQLAGVYRRMGDGICLLARMVWRLAHKDNPAGLPS